jgi:glutamate decarboxylase
MATIVPLPRDQGADLATGPGVLSSGPEPGWEHSGGLPAEVAARQIRDLVAGDTDPRRNLGTFSTTWAEPGIVDLLAAHLDRNLVNEAEYHQTTDLARRCLTWISRLWHGPAEPVGSSTSGSSEAAMLAGLALLRRWQRTPATRQGGRPNLVLGTGAHTCWKRFCLVFDVTARYIPLAGARLTLDPGLAAAACDADTIGVVAVLGSTDHGHYDPVADLHTALEALHRRMGIDIGIHVDAASGGFVAPFLQPELLWDFQLPRVQSINASGHKFGLTFPALGWMLWRSTDALPAELSVHSPYIGGGVDTLTLTFSRSAAPIVHQYYNLIRYGPAGYQTIHQHSLDTARHLSTAITGLGPYQVLAHPERLPVLTFTTNPADLVDLGRALASCGWQMPVYQPTPTSQPVARIVIRHGFTPQHTEELLHHLTTPAICPHQRRTPVN